MSIHDFICDTCGSVFEIELDEDAEEKPIECPICRSHDVQELPSLASVYGFDEEENGGFSCGSGGFL